MFPNIKLSIPKRGSLNDLATSLKKNANDLHNMNPIVTSLKQKRENHALAMQLWEEHANPILKGIGIVDGDKNGVLERNMRLPGKVDSAHEEAEKKHSDFASMNKQEKMVYREEQKILRNKEKRIRKEEKENARAKRRAEKAHNKSTKKDRMNDKLLMKSEVAAEKELEAKMKKKNMSPKDIHIQKLLLHNERRVRMNEVLEDKFGKGKKIAFKNSSEVKRNKLIAVCAPIPGMLYGWTKGTENIKGVYKLGSEREGEKEQRARERKERLEFEAKKEEEMVINAQRKREEKKAKKIRMQGNNGKDPWEEKIAQKELMKGKKLVKKKKKRGEGGESKENEESEESEESGEEGLDREEDIEVEIDSEDDSDHDNNDGEIGIPRDAEEEARMIAEEFKRQARETRNRLKRMGYELSTKCCAACGSKTVGRPVDRWTGELKGGGANQWYIVGDQHFCYGCANNKTLMKGVAKALAIMNGLPASEGIKNFKNVKKMKFQLNYNVDMTFEQNEALNKIEEKGPDLQELREKKMKAERRRNLREKRFAMEEKMARENKREKKSRKGGAKVSNVWWQQKRRREENMWHNEEIKRIDQEIKKKEREDIFAEPNDLGLRIHKKSPAIFASSFEQSRQWFPEKYNDSLKGMPRAG